MESLSTRKITRSGLVAAVYFVLTVALSSLSYGDVQFRVSEALMLLCLFNKDYIYSLTIGCFIANLFSSVGVVDTIVGTSATLFAALCIYFLRDHLNLFTASLFPVVFNAVLVGLELKFVLGLPLLASMAGVAVGEIVCVTIVGGIIFKILIQHKHILHILSDDFEQRSVQKTF